MTLSALKPQTTAVIKSVDLKSEDKAVLWELGLIVGAKITLISFFIGKTALVVVDGAVVAVGREYADKITVEICGE